MSCADFMGVQMQAVGVGETLFIVLSSGTTAAMKAKDAAQDATAAVLSPFTVSPTRLTARYLFRREDMAVINGYEPYTSFRSRRNFVRSNGSPDTPG